VAIFKQLGAPARLNALLEGESLFNDVTAIVVFTLLIGMSLNTTEVTGTTEAIVFFLKSFAGGIVVGTVVGWIAKYLYRLCSNHFGHTLLGIIAAIFTFYIAEHLLHVSGVVAVLSAGLLLGEFYRSEENTDNKFAAEFWELNAYIANAILFILVGVTITVSMFTGQWYAMLLGIIAATIARGLVIYGLLPAFTLIPAIVKIDSNYKNVMMWGGLRGAVSLSLALSIPTEIEAWYTVQSIVYGVVVFTLFVQTPFINKLVVKTLK
ncbi:MAG: cation:proton antiporter, partial [Cycloclasticus sp.]|nr:cation:proton antiporter [Cycloclasticus sp.]